MWLQAFLTRRPRNIFTLYLTRKKIEIKNLFLRVSWPRQQWTEMYRRTVMPLNPKYLVPQMSLYWVEYVLFIPWAFFHVVHLISTGIVHRKVSSLQDLLSKSTFLLFLIQGFIQHMITTQFGTLPMFETDIWYFNLQFLHKIWLWLWKNMLIGRTLSLHSMLKSVSNLEYRRFRCT